MDNSGAGVVWTLALGPAKKSVVFTAWVSEEDPLWSKSCLAYNLHAELEDACQGDLVQGAGEPPVARLVGAAPPARLAPCERGHDAVSEGGLRHLQVLTRRRRRDPLETYHLLPSLIAPGRK